MSAGKKKTARKDTPRGPLLKARDIRFCQKIVCDGMSFYEAYLAAGFPAKANRHATDQAAYRTVRKRVIWEYLCELRDYAAEAAKVTTDELATFFRRVVRADMRKLMNAKGGLLLPQHWPDEHAAAVETVDIGEFGAEGKKKVGIKKLKLCGKVAAATKLAEWIRMIGQSKEDNSKATDKPLVVGGANPDKL